jgi:septum formation protein
MIEGDLTRGQTQKLILASRSPERRAILKDLGYECEVRPVDFDETPLLKEKPEDLVKRLALGKAQASSAAGCVVAADTVVVYGGEILGKPKNRDHAREMLLKMNGEKIEVFTGTAVRKADAEVVVGIASATLKMNFWEPPKWEVYLDTGLWKNRAGAFSVFHDPAPVKIMKGNMDVVRGIDAHFVVEHLN